jgi:hypothetical protein
MPRRAAKLAIPLVLVLPQTKLVLKII